MSTAEQYAEAEEPANERDLPVVMPLVSTATDLAKRLNKAFAPAGRFRTCSRR
jgi:hypothetical protein